MNKTNKIICEICHKFYSVYGLAGHIRRGHKLNYYEYKTKYLSRKCFICGSLVEKHRKFCSQECYHEAIKRKVIIKKRIPRKEFNKELLEKMIKYYNTTDSTYIDISKKFNVSIDKVGELFRLNRVCIRKGTDYMKTLRDEKFKEFCLTEGKKIANDYLKKGQSIRSIHRKYKFSRKYIRNILKGQNVKIKTNPEAKREIDELKRINNIRHPNYKKKPPVGAGHCFWYLYQGVTYQGSWELRVGWWLIKDNIRFFCHTGVKQFSYIMDGQQYTYCPDFYIPKWDQYIEVKGYFSDYEKRKMDIIKETYPEIKIDIYDKEKLKKYGILNIEKELGLDVRDYVLNKKTKNIMIDEFLETVDRKKLFDDYFIEKKNLNILSKTHKIPYLIFCRAFYKVFPKDTVSEYYKKKREFSKCH